ncbi:MAG: hypothetical protein KDD64_16700 [Bdellovibrionales bacterium]|nr:hypothetical protein [Bdellovibrionales bacterium]
MSNTETKKKFPLKWILGGILALIAIWTFSSYNTLVSAEENIRGQDKVVLTAVDSMVRKIRTAGATATNLKETIIEVMQNTIGPNGRGGAGSFINAVAERYPEVDASVWQSVIQTANAEYEAMEQAQNVKITMVAQFRKKLRQPQYIPAKMLGGFPTIDLDWYDKLILGNKARQAGETGELGDIDPFKNDD